jgi:hypothetical protein
VRSPLPTALPEPDISSPELDPTQTDRYHSFICLNAVNWSSAAELAIECLGGLIAELT